MSATIAALITAGLGLATHIYREKTNPANRLLELENQLHEKYTQMLKAYEKRDVDTVSALNLELKRLRKEKRAILARFRQDTSSVPR